jgi:putative PIN family toxin of toxin-antitoxin system
VRAVLDANVMVSGLITPSGPSGRILDLVARGGRLRTVLSPAIAAEYRRSLLYPKVRVRHGLAEADVDAWIGTFVLLSVVVPDALDLRVVKEDPDDDKYLVAAVEGMATHIVSGDHHLLDLRVHDGIRILPPAAFLREAFGDGLARSDR